MQMRDSPEEQRVREGAWHLEFFFFCRCFLALLSLHFSCRAQPRVFVLAFARATDDGCRLEMSSPGKKYHISQGREALGVNIIL